LKDEPRKIIAWAAPRRSSGATVQRGAAGVKRARFGGLFWTLALGVVLLRTQQQARARPPFLTDDPGFTDNRWELKTLLQYEHHKDRPDVLIGPRLDINYTLVPGFKFNVTLADTDAKFKWRFFDEHQGLGDDAYKLKVPFQFGKTIVDEHRWFTYSEVGFAKKLDEREGAREPLIFGAVLRRNVTNQLFIGVEIYNESSLYGSANISIIVNLGATYTLSEHWNIQLGVGKFISANDGPDLIVQFLAQWNF